jgi:type IV pilus assembly protein PilW
MANYWGFNSRADYINNRATETQGVPSVFSGREADIDICGNNWAINLDQDIGGSNNGYFTTATGCLAFNGSHRAGTDTLVVRRAAELPSDTLDPNRIYIQTSRIQGTLFVPLSTCTDAKIAGCLPEGYAPPQSRSHVLQANAYYVANDSTGRIGFPSLRRKRMVGGTGSQIAQIQDEEIVPGVEDLQVRFGIDTNGDANVDQYVNPGAVPATAAVISATIWLRVRADDPEVGHVDNRTYQYADVTVAAPNDNFRRILVSKTIQLRNTRP